MYCIKGLACAVLRPLDKASIFAIINIERRCDKWLARVR